MKEKKNESKKTNDGVLHCALLLAIITTVAYFGYTVIKSFDRVDQLSSIVIASILVIFAIAFVIVALSTNEKGKTYALIGALLLTGYSSLHVLADMDLLPLPKQSYVEDFTNQESVVAVKWAAKNKITLNQVYENSDVIDEYHIISQDIEPGTLTKKIKELTIVVSDGPNLEKEVIIPNMIGWKAEDVLDFIKRNHLSNVEVEFVVSDKPKDTVINQEGSGSQKRNDLLKLTFSIGSETDIKPVKMIDLTGKSKFEAIFWLKQHGIPYQEETAYSDTYKKDQVMKQSIKKGTTVDPSKDNITITISKGGKITVPDLMNMNLTEITEWITANKLKIELTDRYDEKIKVNMPIEVNYQKGAIIEEGTVIKIVISKGPLKMESFSSLAEFKLWADQYGIKYNEEYEFSDNVAQGEIIRWSHKKGDVINNNDAVTVTISQGKKTTVPNFSGMTKNEATKACNQHSLSCSFLYRYSNTVAEGKAFDQSKAAGMEVAENTSVSITISNGKAPASSGSSGNSGSSSNPAPSCDTSKGAMFYIAPGNTGSQVFDATRGQNPGFTIKVNYVKSCPNGSTTSGAVCNSNDYDGKWISFCTTITLSIVE